MGIGAKVFSIGMQLLEKKAEVEVQSLLASLRFIVFKTILFALGCAALVAAAIIQIGHIYDGQYGLSAVCVGVFLFTVSALVPIERN